MRGRKKKAVEPKKAETKPVVEAKPVPATSTEPIMYTLTKDVNLSLKAGMKVSAEEYGKLVSKGMRAWFE